MQGVSWGTNWQWPESQSIHSSRDLHSDCQWINVFGHLWQAWLLCHHAHSWATWFEHSALNFGPILVCKPWVWAKLPGNSRFLFWVVNLSHLNNSDPWQIRPIKNSHAYMLIILVDISPNEAITVKYTKDGYHDDTVPCLCSTCCPGNPPAAPKRKLGMVDILYLHPMWGKKTRWEGRKYKTSLRGKWSAASTSRKDQMDAESSVNPTSY